MALLEIINSAVPSNRIGSLKKSVRGNSSLVHGAQLLPALFWVFAVLGGSLFIVFVFSFSSDPPAVEFSLEHYRTFVNNPFYLEIMWDSFWTAVVVTAVTFVMAYPAAYYFSFFDLKYKNVFLLLIILPFWVNLVIRTYAWRLILSPRGMINYVLVDTLHVLNEPVNLLFSQNAVTIGLIHVFLPFMWIPIYASLERIDREDIEGAKNLGANKLEAFFEVTFPQSLPGISSGVILVFVLAFGSFVVPLLLGGQKNIMIANIIADMFRQIQAWGLGSTVSVIFFVMVLALIYLFNRFVGLEELYGGDTAPDTVQSPNEPRQSSSRFGLVPKRRLAGVVPGHRLGAVRKRVTSMLDFSPKTVDWLFSFYTLAIFAFLYLPIFVVVLLSFTSRSTPVFPIPDVSLKWYAELIDNPAIISAATNSLLIGVTTAIISGVVGTLAALGIVRGEFRSRWLQLEVLNTAIMAPIVIPWIVTGIAVLMLFSLVGIQGTIYSLIIGHVLITLPFVAIVVASQLYGFDRSMEEAAKNLGASSIRTFYEITLPQIAPSVIAGMLFAFTISFDNFTQTFFWTGPGLETLPIRIYGMLRTGMTPDINALGTVILGVSLTLILIAEILSERIAE